MPKIILIAIAVCLNSSFLFAQDFDKEIGETLSAYWTVVNNKDVDGTLDYMYPKMFEIAPRELLKSTMESMYEDEEMEIGFGDNKLIGIQNLKYKGDTKFATVDYSFDMTMKILSLVQTEKEIAETKNKVAPIKDDDGIVEQAVAEESDEEMEVELGDEENEDEFDEYALIHSMYNEQFGEENVKADRPNGSFLISKTSTMLAIHEGEGGWKFLEVKSEMMPILKNILPEEIIKQLAE